MPLRVADADRAAPVLVPRTLAPRGRAALLADDDAAEAECPRAARERHRAERPRRAEGERRPGHRARGAGIDEREAQEFEREHAPGDGDQRECADLWTAHHNPPPAMPRPDRVAAA